MDAAHDGRLGTGLDLSQRRDVREIEVARRIVPYEVADALHAKPFEG